MLKHFSFIVLCCCYSFSGISQTPIPLDIDNLIGKWVLLNHTVADSKESDDLNLNITKNGFLQFEKDNKCIADINQPLSLFYKIENQAIVFSEKADFSQYSQSQVAEIIALNESFLSIKLNIKNTTITFNFKKG